MIVSRAKGQVVELCYFFKMLKALSKVSLPGRSGMITYFSWWYGQEPKLIWKALIIVTKKTFYAFSVPLLLGTLFDPWKRDLRRAENASLDVVFRLMLENLISRLVGFIIRIFTIITGLVLTLVVFILMLAGFLIWLGLPIIVIYLIVNGISTVINV